MTRVGTWQRWSVVCAVILFLCIGVSVLPSPVLADESPLPPVPGLEDFSATDSAIPFGSERRPEVIDPLTERYFSLVEDYRDADEQFQIAREQYYQLNTLTAQEEVVRRGKTLLQFRDEVLLAYLEYMQTVVEQTTGIELAAKTNAVVNIKTWRDWLTIHKEQVPDLNSRQAINDHLVIFNEQQRPILHTVYSTLALIKLGELQTANDTAVLLHQDLAPWLDDMDFTAAVRAKKERGLNEVAVLLQTVRNTLTDMYIKHQQALEGGSYSSSSYSTFQQRAEYGYLQLRQAASFLKEIGEI